MPVRIKGLEDIRTATEDQIQTAAVQLLRLSGYIVLVTTTRGVRGRTGVTPGIPDLLVTRENWLPGQFVGIEMKKPKGPVSEYQGVLLAKGRILIARSPEEALAFAQSYRTQFDHAFKPDQAAVDAAEVKLAMKKATR